MPYIDKNSKKPSSRQGKRPMAYLWGITALAVVILAVALATRPGAFTAEPAEQPGTAAAAGTPAAQSGDVVIQIKDISETAAFYPTMVDGVSMEVLAVKAPDGTIRTALNTCQVCYDSGRGYYVQEGSMLVCQNCGNRFRTSDLEKVRGGCNPVPILAEDKVVDETTITVPVEFLQKAKALFSDWKR